MLERPFAHRRCRLATLASPALLPFLVQAAGCGQPADPVATLALEFPQHVDGTLRAGRGFVAAGGTFVAPAAGSMTMALPARGGDAVVFRGSLGFEARVIEAGAGGPGAPVERAVMYPRAGGASFWTTAPRGVEEWIHVAPGRADRFHPAATWHVEGAFVTMRGGAIELVDGVGRTRVEVTAPAAFAAGDRPVSVRLRAADASTIEVYADAGGEAALIDPIWTAVAPMLAPRYEHASAALGSGDVVATGGTPNGNLVLDTAEVYDPTADAWTDVGPMNASHVCHTATSLNDGTVLVAGGLGSNGQAENESETYSATAGAWTAEGSMAWNRFDHTASLLTNMPVVGEVLVVGGYGFAGGGSGTAEMLPPVPQIFPGGLSSCFSIGNSGGPNATGAAEIYDPTLQGWTSVTAMNQPHARHTATVLQDGTVLVTGGMSFGNVTSDTEIYDPVMNVWNQQTSGLITPRTDHVAAILPTGDVLVAGGASNNGTALASAEIFHNGSWSAAPPMGTARIHATSTVLPDGTVLVTAGTDGTNSLATAEIYDPVAQAWTPTSPMVSPHSQHTATSLMSGSVLVAGGLDDTPAATVNAEVFLWKLPNGLACTAETDCSSANCVQGVCCDTACAGAPACQACAAAMGATQDGTCTSINTGMTCDSSPCMISGVCQAGACTATVPKVCTAVDVCHDPGTCDLTTGMCPVGPAKLDGSPCPVGTCNPDAGPCAEGVCIAAACVPDPVLTPSSSASSGGTGGSAASSTSGAGGTTGAGGAGGGPVDTNALLSGSGCDAGGSRPGNTGLAGLVAALCAMLGLRRRRSRPS